MLNQEIPFLLLKKKKVCSVIYLIEIDLFSYGHLFTALFIPN